MKWNFVGLQAPESAPPVMHSQAQEVTAHHQELAGMHADHWGPGVCKTPVKHSPPLVVCGSQSLESLARAAVPAFIIGKCIFLGSQAP